MNIAEMKDAVKLAVEMDEPLMIWGPPGVGKTQGVQQVADELGYKLIDVRLSQRDAIDLRGTPCINKETKRTEWMPPATWPGLDDKDKTPTIIMFDELNHGAPSTLKTTFQIIQEKQIAEHKFPETTRFIAASNRASHRTYANALPSALKNRFVHIDVDSSIDDWAKWANQEGVNPVLIGFLRFMPQALNEFTKGADTDAEEKRLDEAMSRDAFGTPRSWLKVDKLLNARPDAMETHQTILQGIVGPYLATQLIGFYKYYKDLPDLKKLLADPSGSFIPEKPQTLYALCSALAGRVSKKNFGKIMDYIVRIPKEFQVACVCDCLARDMTLSTNAKFLDWTTKNTDVLF